MGREGWARATQCDRISAPGPVDRTMSTGHWAKCLAITAPRPSVNEGSVVTSTLGGGAALLDGELVVGEYALDVSATHSERLMGAIDRLLTDAGWTVHDLEGLAVSVGPGSFTGLRIGLSTVKGLALALSIPLLAVPTLHEMAALLPFAALPVCPVLVARKPQGYPSLYRWDGAG